MCVVVVVAVAVTMSVRLFVRESEFVEFRAGGLFPAVGGWGFDWRLPLRGVEGTCWRSRSYADTHAGFRTATTRYAWSMGHFGRGALQLHGAHRVGASVAVGDDTVVVGSAVRGFPAWRPCSSQQPAMPSAEHLPRNPTTDKQTHLKQHSLVLEKIN